jgi:hypothetical protein
MPLIPHPDVIEERLATLPLTKNAYRAVENIEHRLSGFLQGSHDPLQDNR